MDKISAEDIFGKTDFKTYSEFNLALALAKACSLYGKVFDMSMMTIDKSILPDSAFKQFKELISEGCICVDEGEVDGEEKEIAPNKDVGYFRNILLYNVISDKAEWSFEWANANYGSDLYTFMVYEKMGYSIMNVVATFLIRKYLGIEDSQKLFIKISHNMSKNVFTYINIYSCRASMKWFASLIDLEVSDSSKNPVDLDYMVFCNNSYMSHKYKYYTDAEKVEILKKLGIEVGSILVLWERKGMCENSIFGRIKSASIVRLDEIGDTFLGFAGVALNKTKEEVRKEYYDIPSEKRYLFSDILTKEPVANAYTKSYMYVGIDEYFKDEEYILTKLDQSEKVVKLVTIDGNEKSVEMRGVDAIYWLLRQYNIEFDVDLYREMYCNGEELLWDLYHGEG